MSGSSEWRVSTHCCRRWSMCVTRRGSASSTPARKPFKAIHALACPSTSKSPTNAVLVSNCFPLFMLIFINFAPEQNCQTRVFKMSDNYSRCTIVYVTFCWKILDPYWLWVEKRSISQTSIQWHTKPLNMVLKKNFSLFPVLEKTNFFKN